MTEPKRDWLMASDRCAHLMDALQRQLIQVEFQEPGSNFGSTFNVRFKFRNRAPEYQEYGNMSLNLSTREWSMDIAAVKGESSARASIETREVPEWMVEALPGNVKAHAMRLVVQEAKGPAKKDPDDDIPF